jgi:hypothetical protein
MPGPAPSCNLTLQCLMLLLLPLLSATPGHCLTQRVQADFNLQPPHTFSPPPPPRLYDMGILPVKKSLVQCDKLATAAFCRRRLAVVMVRAKMAETLREAVTFIEQVGEENSGLTCADMCCGATPGGASARLGA